MEAMAISMAEFGITTLLEKLGSFLTEEASLLAGVEDEIKDINDELTSIDAFLRVLSSRQDLDDQVKVWIQQVKEMAYDAEDSIEEFRCSLRRRQCKQGVRGFLRGTFTDPLRRLKTRHSVASELKKLKLEAQKIRERHERFAPASGTAPGGSSSGAAMYADPRIFALFVEEAQLVGIDRHRDTLCRWLMEKNHPQLAVNSLVGFGGLGKTTLARQVYKCQDVTGGHFQVRAWIAVSQSFDIKTLLRKLIKEISSSQEQLDKMEEVHELTEAIRDNLHDKRYMIVLDDIWTVEAWKSLHLALPDNRNGSRIIVTTRIEDVGNICCPHTYDLLFKIPPLSPDLSWQLFCRRVFEAPEHTCPPDLETIGKDILRKCKGLPLAIVTIACLLAAKPNKTPEEWKKLHTHFSTELETNTNLANIIKILRLSYNDLPYHLKLCFLYLGIFPEDFEINRKRLMRKWIVEGLVSKRRDMSLEEVAESYANELVNRNLIIPSKINFDGKVKSYRVHDMMLEVVLSVSREENFLTLQGDSSTANSTHGKIRRLLLRGRGSTLDPTLNLSHVRSVTAFGPSAVLLQDYGRLRLLRMLDLEGCEGLDSKHLKTICKLFLLKFLSLRSTDVIELPESIGDLQNLEFLDLVGCNVADLPNSIVKLQRLTYLVGGHPIFTFHCLHLPRRMGQLKSLRELGTIIIDDLFMLQEIAELTQLEKLSFYFCYTSCDDSERTNYGELLCTLLAKLSTCLRYLRIFVDPEHDVLLHQCSQKTPPLLLEKVIIYGPLGSLPNWFASLNRIVKIKLVNTRLQHHAFHVLKDLPTLVHLVLGRDSFDEEVRLCFDCDGFAGLRQLVIVRISVSFKVGALQNLKLLKLVPHIHETDDTDVSGLLNLLKLEEIHIHGRPVDGLEDMVSKDVKCHPNHPQVISGYLPRSMDNLVCL